MKKKRTFEFSEYERKALVNCVLAVFQSFCDIPFEKRTLKDVKVMRCFSRLLSILD